MVLPLRLRRQGQRLCLGHGYVLVRRAIKAIERTRRAALPTQSPRNVYAGRHEEMQKPFLPRRALGQCSPVRLVRCKSLLREILVAQMRSWPD